MHNASALASVSIRVQKEDVYLHPQD